MIILGIEMFSGRKTRRSFEWIVLEKERGQTENVEETNTMMAIDRARIHRQHSIGIHILHATHLNLFQLPRPEKHFKVRDILEKQRYKNIKAHQMT